MRVVRFSHLIGILFLILSAARPAHPGGQTSSSVSAAQLLQQSLAALTGGQSITDVTLSGTARRIAGSDDESGTVVIKALAGTGSRMDLTLPSGPRSEIRNTSSAAIAGSWSGPDGISHATVYHNLLADPAWSPAIAIADLLSARNAVITYVGPETRDGQSVLHLTASQQFHNIPDPSNLLQHLSQTDIFLDPNTHLPAAIAYNIHPDNNSLLDIPVELRFSAYQPVSGAEVPLHIQEFLNNSLFLDLQFSSANLNSSLSPTIFTVEAGLQPGSSSAVAASQSASEVKP